jgi:hypothetical protein
MLLTGEPQFVGLTSNSGGHAIIAHKISLTEKKIYVCDPNYPGQEKVITFTAVVLIIIKQGRTPNHRKAIITASVITQKHQ